MGAGKRKEAKWGNGQGSEFRPDTRKRKKKTKLETHPRYTQVWGPVHRGTRRAGPLSGGDKPHKWTPKKKGVSKELEEEGPKGGAQGRIAGGTKCTHWVDVQGGDRVWPEKNGE